MEKSAFDDMQKTFRYTIKIFLYNITVLNILFCRTEHIDGVDFCAIVIE